MASVGALSAYAVSITHSRVKERDTCIDWSKFRPTLSLYKGCIIISTTVSAVRALLSLEMPLTNVVSSFYLFSRRSMVFSHVRTADWLLSRWNRPSVSCIPIEYDMADHACVLCVIQYPAFATVCGEWFVRRYESRTFLSIRVHWIVPMV